MEQGAASEKQNKHMYDDFHICRNCMSESEDFVCKHRLYRKDWFIVCDALLYLVFGSFLAEMYDFRIKLSSYFLFIVKFFLTSKRVLNKFEFNSSKIHGAFSI